MSYRHLYSFRESSCDFLFIFHMWGFLGLSRVVHMLYYGRLQIFDGDSGLVTVLILEDCCDQYRLIRVLLDISLSSDRN